MLRAGTVRLGLVPALKWDGTSRAEAPAQRGQRSAHGLNYNCRSDPASCSAPLLFQGAGGSRAPMALEPCCQLQSGEERRVLGSGRVWEWVILKVCAATRPLSSPNLSSQGRGWAAPRFLLSTMETTVLQPQDSACPLGLNDQLVSSLPPSRANFYSLDD